MNLNVHDKYYCDTAFMYAAHIEHDKCLQMLIDAGCDLNLKDIYNRTTLHFICKNNLINSLIFLLN